MISKKMIILASAVFVVGVLGLNNQKVYAQNGVLADSMEQVGVATILDDYKTEEEYKEAAQNDNNYGYSNIGIASVEGHLNVRKEPSTESGLAGKMSNNAACEVINIEGEWAQIKSGEVEGYCHTDYLLTGVKARMKAKQIVTRQARSKESGLRVRSGPSLDSEIITTMGEGETLDVVDDTLEDWIEVTVDDETGFISKEYSEVVEELSTAITMTELLYGEGVSDVRVDLCQYAKEFIGNPYVWGGTSLTKGADCSGFVLSVFKKYGFSLPHSSRAQSQMGTKVSLGEARAGDLVFYAKGGTVNHVAIYVGNGQVVHASNPRTGIRISNVGYRTIHSIRRIIKD